MFTLDLIAVSWKQPCADGLAALDERRRLGLPDAAQLRCSEMTERIVGVKVPEAFARRHAAKGFGACATVKVQVSLSVVDSQDVVEIENGNGYVCLSPNISPERAMLLAERAWRDE